jgi:dUTP pyrophosphatase
MKVKIKKLHPDAVLPKYGKPGDAGMDLTAISITNGDCYTEYGTGLSIKVPEGYVGLIFPRSSISNKLNILSNSVGVIDSGYVGEIKFRFKVDGYTLNRALEKGKDGNEYLYQIGDRVGQIIILPYPQIEFEEVEELEITERGEGSFGSTGK